MLKDKTIILGVTGSIAAYKAANLASLLIKMEAQVHVIMTQNATQFIHPITFESLTNHKCLVDTFDRNFEFHVNHVGLAKKADLVIIAPATANVIGKLACGIADDMLTTTVMACQCKKLIAPAMNTNMYENPIVQDNLKKLQEYGYGVIDSQVGLLACMDIGKGKMAEPKDIVEAILKEIAFEKDLMGKKVLITAGPTQEALDPVRFISNYSTGKMGYAIAKMAMLRGAEVTLISGPTSIQVPPYVRLISIKSAHEMFQTVKAEFDHQDIIIKAAAVADFRSCHINQEKTKKTDCDMVIKLERTEDILLHLGKEKKKHQFLCGFSMETENLLENSRQKLIKKNLDMIVANNLREKGAGFGTDTNRVTLVAKDMEKELPLLSKEEVANQILTEIINRLN